MTQGYTTEQTWAKPATPAPAPQAEPAPAVDFGTPPPVVSETQTETPAPEASTPVVDDPNRPARRVKK